MPGGTSGIKRIEVGQLRRFTEPMLIVSGKPGKETVHCRAPDYGMVAEELRQFIGRAIIDMVIAQDMQHQLWLCNMSRQMQKSRANY